MLQGNIFISTKIIHLPSQRLKSIALQKRNNRILKLTVFTARKNHKIRCDVILVQNLALDRFNPIGSPLCSGKNIGVHNNTPRPRGFKAGIALYNTKQLNVHTRMRPWSGALSSTPLVNGEASE